MIYCFYAELYFEGRHWNRNLDVAGYFRHFTGRHRLPSEQPDFVFETGLLNWAHDVA